MNTGGDDRNSDGLAGHAGGTGDGAPAARVIGRDQLPGESLGRPETTAPVEEPMMLSDMDERLPWLESDDDFDGGGVDIGRLVTLALVALAALVGLLGLLWFLSQPDTDGAVLDEGATIEAPDAPYRTAPEDPGGAEVAGTGDMSFEVGEGQSRDSQLGTDDNAKPTVDRTQTAPSPAPTPTAATPAAAGGVPIQVAAYSSRARAEQGWNEIRNRYEALSGLNHRIEEAVVDGATVYRLQAVAGSVAAAETVCRSVRAEGGDCQIKR